MKHLIVSAIAAVTLLIAATTMLWSQSPSTERHAAATVQELPQPGRDKSFRAFALLSANSRQKGAAIFFRTWPP